MYGLFFLACFDSATIFQILAYFGVKIVKIQWLRSQFVQFFADLGWFRKNYCGIFQSEQKSHFFRLHRVLLNMP